MYDRDIRICSVLVKSGGYLLSLQFCSCADTIAGDSSALKGGGIKNRTKRVAQNRYSIKFPARQTPRKIQNSFL